MTTRRTNWPWRDWVIGAFNRNLPFDQFTIEQFAGDLLPKATLEQKLATCFHRNHMTNGEGGRDPEESRIDYVIDRVNTTGARLARHDARLRQCHSHRYDPISQADYYKLFAFFNSIDEDGKAGRAAKPYLTYPSPYTRARRRRSAEDARRTPDARSPRPQRRGASFSRHGCNRRRKEVRGGFQAWRPFAAASFETLEGTQLVQEADGVIQTADRTPARGLPRHRAGEAGTRDRA